MPDRSDIDDFIFREWRDITEEQSTFDDLPILSVGTGDHDPYFEMDPLVGVDWDYVEPPSDSFPIWPLYSARDAGDTYHVDSAGEPRVIPFVLTSAPSDCGVRCLPRAFVDESGTVRQCVYSNGLCRFFCQGKSNGDCSEIKYATQAIQDIVTEANQRLTRGAHPAAKAPDTAKRNIIRPSEAPSPVKDKETKGAAKKRGR